MTPEQLDEIEKDALETDWQPDFRDALKLVKALREARAEVERLNRELQSHDCTHRDTPWLIHCPIDKPCSLHRIEELTHKLKEAACL